MAPQVNDTLLLRAYIVILPSAVCFTLKKKFRPTWSQYRNRKGKELYYNGHPTTCYQFVRIINAFIVYTRIHVMQFYTRNVLRPYGVERNLISV